MNRLHKTHTTAINFLSNWTLPWTWWHSCNESASVVYLIVNGEITEEKGEKIRGTQERSRDKRKWYSEHLNTKLVQQLNGQFWTQIMLLFQMALSAILFLTNQNLDQILEHSTKKSKYVYGGHFESNDLNNGLFSFTTLTNDLNTYQTSPVFKCSSYTGHFKDTMQNNPWRI
jgi:hypothetical protein